MAVRHHPLFLPLGALAALGLAQWTAATLFAGAESDPSELPKLSLWSIATASPWATRSALVLLLAYGVLLFLVVQTVTRRHLRYTVFFVIGSAVVPTLYGLGQYLSGNPTIFGYVNRGYPGRLFGTFINANHFATYLGMSLCLAIGALGGWTASRERQTLEARSGGRLAVWLITIALGAAIVAFALALVLTASRAGVTSVLVGLGLSCAWAVGRRRGVLAGCAFAGAWLVVGLLGLSLAEPLRERLVVLWRHPWEEGRLAAWEATLTMAGNARVFGAGLGSYRKVFPHFQQLSLPPEIYQNAAHNELLELLATMGAVGLGIAGWAGVRLSRWTPRSSSEADRFGRAVAWGISAGLIVLLLHSVVDFPLQTPANAVLALVLAGLLPCALGRQVIREVNRGLSWRGRVSLVAAAVGLLGIPAALVAGEALAERLDATEDVADEVILTAPPGNESNLLQSLALDPQRSRYRLRLAELYAVRGYEQLGKGVIDEARVLMTRAEGRYREAISLDRWWALPRARLAWLYGVMDATWPGELRLPDPIALFEAAMALEPRNPYLPELLATWALQRSAALGNHPARVRLVDVGYAAARRAIEIQPRLLPELATVALGLSSEYSQLVRLLPESPLDRIALAQFLNDQSLRMSDSAGSQTLWAAARMAFEDGISTAIRRGQHDALAQARAAYSRALLQHAQPENALAVAREGRTAARGEPVLAALEAQALTSLGRLKEAEAVYRETLVLASGLGQKERRVHLLEEFARLYERMRTPERALATWQEALSLNPQEGEAHVGMGRAYDALGQPVRALGEYRAAVIVSPHDAGVRSRVAEALFKRGLYDEAISHWELLVRRHPDDWNAHLRLGEARERLSDSLAAERHYAEALRLAPGNATALSALNRLRGRR